MAKPNSMFYCSLLGGESFDEFAHLGSLREVMEHMQDEELRHLLRRCREGGRQDWPVEAMLNAYYAMIVLQYRSIESLRRNLAANPTLMRVCGFPMKANKKDNIRVPSKSAFSRFMKLLEQLEREHGAMYALFERNRDRLMELCPDFGTSLGFDGKKLHSYSTGRIRSDGTCSDPDADWGRQVYRGVGSDGKPWSHEVKWFGYRLHLVADTRYELPFDFRVEAASVSETPVCREMMSEILSDTEAGARCVDFVADRGLDDDQLRRQLHERGVTPFIETRRMWKDEPLGDIRKPTRALCEDRVDTMVYTECGKVYCVCPQSGEVRPVAYAGFEKKRQTLKYRCPAVEYGLHCAGRDECHRMGGISPNAKQRIVRIKINDGKHPMRTFGPCPRNTRKWKQTFDRRNSLERINARVGRDFQVDDHFLRGKSAMHLRIAGSMAVMLAIALGCLEKNKPDKMRSLVTSPAA